MLRFIEIAKRRSHEDMPSTAFIISLFTLPYKRQSKAGNWISKRKFNKSCVKTRCFRREFSWFEDHTYRHWLLKPFNHNYGILPHTSGKCRCSEKLTWNDRFLRNSSRQVSLLSEFQPEICREETEEEIFFFYISFWCLTRETNPGFTEPTH